MNSQSAASAYTKITYESAPPIKIVHMMYEGALRFIEQAESIDPEKEAAAFSDKLNRADAIVSELRISLEHSHAPELAAKLNSLYLFVEGQIREAFLDRTPAPLPSARGILETLLDAWRAIELDAADTESS